MILGADRPSRDAGAMPDAAQPERRLARRAASPRAERWAAAGVHGATVWLTGLSGSGKSTIASARRAAGSSAPGVLSLHARRRQPAPRPQRRPRLLAPPTAPRTCAASARSRACSPTPGVVALVPLISPYRAGRDHARALHEAAGLAVRRGVRRHAARGVRARATRRASTRRPGPASSPGFTGDRRPVRAARAARASWSAPRSRPADEAAASIEARLDAGRHGVDAWARTARRAESG